MLSLLKDCAIDLVEAASAAAQTTLTTDVLDMAGFDGVCFIASLGDVDNGSVLALKALGHTANAASGAAITGAEAGLTASATSADSKLLIVDVVRPVKRYVYATLERGSANAVVNCIIAIRYRGSKCPITQGSSVVASALVTA